MDTKRIIILFSLLISFFALKAQETATVVGTVKDKDGKVVEGANIAIIGETGGAISKKDGTFTFKISANTEVTIGVTFVGYSTYKKTLTLKANEKFTL